VNSRQVIEVVAFDDAAKANVLLAAGLIEFERLLEAAAEFRSLRILSSVFETKVDSVTLGLNSYFVKLGDGTVRAWGANNRGQLGDGTNIDRSTPVKLANLSNVTAIAVGDYHSLALLADGTVRAWGSNADGQLGTPPPLAATNPESFTDSRMPSRSPRARIAPWRSSRTAP
jgi:alpha-tubulin suppressor-like RCC1 family protein